MVLKELLQLLAVREKGSNARKQKFLNLLLSSLNVIVTRKRERRAERRL